MGETVVEWWGEDVGDNESHPHGYDHGGVDIHLAPLLHDLGKMGRLSR
jgi:hypothetical protein